MIGNENLKKISNVLKYFLPALTPALLVTVIFTQLFTFSSCGRGRTQNVSDVLLGLCTQFVDTLRQALRSLPYGP